MVTQHQQMDAPITAVKEAIKEAQRELSLELRSNPQNAPQIAGKVLHDLDEVDKLLTELKRDAERPIGTSPNVNPDNTGLKAANIKSIRDAHSQTTEDQYQAAKSEAAQEGKPLTRERVRAAGNSTAPLNKKRNSTKQLRLENEQLQNRVYTLEARVSTLEGVLKDHQIPLPM